MTIADARLCLVLDGPSGHLLEPALAGGVDLVVLRDPDPARAAETFRDVTAAYGALLAVVDRPDVALTCGADAVHAEELIALDAAPPGLLLGRSIRSVEEIAAAQGADYLFVGPVFSTPTHPERKPIGLDAVRVAAARSPVPWFAIGGLEVANARVVVEAGATRLAVVRAIRDAPDPEAAARLLRAVTD